MHKDATVCRFACTICSFRCHVADTLKQQEKERVGIYTNNWDSVGLGKNLKHGSQLL